MAFHEIQFPPSISYGSRGGPGYKTSIIELEGGGESRVAHLSVPRHRYNVTEGVKSWDDLSTLKTFYVSRQGPLNGFRFKDWLDYTSHADGRTTPTDADQAIGSYTSGTQTYQLLKRYTDAGGNVVRTIYKPVSGSLVLAVNGTNQASGFSVDTATGVVTITSATDTGTVTVGYEYDVPVRFGEEVDELFDISLDAFEVGSIRIPLVELVQSTAADDDFLYGGAKTFAFSANISISKPNGRVIALNPTTTSLEVSLPAKADLALGGPHFYVVNFNATNGVDIKDVDDASTVVALTSSVGATPSATLVLGLDGAGDRIWYALT